MILDKSKISITIFFTIHQTIKYCFGKLYGECHLLYSNITSNGNIEYFNNKSQALLCDWTLTKILCHENSAWWRHQMETFCAVLAICAGNSPVPCEFPTQRPVTQSCDVFFDLRLNTRLSKQSWGWWFETPSRPLWRQCNVNAPIINGTDHLCGVWCHGLFGNVAFRVFDITIPDDGMYEWWHVNASLQSGHSGESPCMARMHSEWLGVLHGHVSITFWLTELSGLHCLITWGAQGPQDGIKVAM